MKAPSIVFTLALSLVAPLILAQEKQDHQAHHPEATAPDKALAMPSPMQQRLDRMQAIVERLGEASDPAQRRKLMEEHRQMMQETQSMAGPAQGGMGMMSRPGMMPMMQRMEAMQAEMDEIINTDDPAKRLELMKEHRQKMQETMGKMCAMHQGGGMGMMGKGAMPMMEKQGQAGLLEAFQQMDKRLDLMQQMLERLMEKQD